LLVIFPQKTIVNKEKSGGKNKERLFDDQPIPISRTEILFLVNATETREVRQILLLQEPSEDLDLTSGFLL
jgi:hypothetical protein